MTFEQIKSVVAEAAKLYGVTQYEVYYSESEGMSTETLKDEISSFTSENASSVDFRCIINGRAGYASTQLLEEDEISELVKKAAANAAVCESDDELEFFAGSESYGEVDMPEPVIPSAAALREAALALQKKTYSLSDKIADGTQSAVGAAISGSHMYNSHGLELSQRYGVNYGYVSVVVKEGEESVSAFKGANGSTFEELESACDKAVNKALSQIGAEPAPTGEYPIIIASETMRSLLSTFAPVFSAKNAEKGLSLLKGKEGEVIAADCVSIVDDPFRPGSVQSAFDGEGVATYTKNVVENGVLNTLLYNLSSAKKAGKTTTGNGNHSNGIRYHNFYIKPGSYTREELLKTADGGIFITEFKGLHAGANATTGDFSVESAGYMIENGALGKPVKSFTIAGNFFKLLKDIAALGNTVDFGLSTSPTVFASPDIYLPKMPVAGK